MAPYSSWDSHLCAFVWEHTNTHDAYINTWTSMCMWVVLQKTTQIPKWRWVTPMVDPYYLWVWGCFAAFAFKFYTIYCSLICFLGHLQLSYLWFIHKFNPGISERMIENLAGIFALFVFCGKFHCSTLFLLNFFSY